MKVVFYLLTKRSLLELLIILIISFMLFFLYFGGFPYGGWIALNIYPFMAGISSWIIVKLIMYTFKIKNTLKYNLFIFLVSVLLCIFFMYVFKKL